MTVVLPLSLLCLVPIKQYHAPPHGGISLPSLFYPKAVVFHFILLVLVLSRFRASSRVLLLSVSSALTGPIGANSFMQAWTFGRGHRGHVGAQQLQDGAAGDSRRITSTHIKITLLPKYPASNRKKAKPDDERIIFQSLDACRKSPQSPADTRLPCIINQWQLCSPMDST